MDKALKNQIIRLYLERIKEAVKQNHSFFVPRKENQQTLTALGLTVNDVNACILRLSMGDYHKGPEHDHEGSAGQIWVFKHPVTGCDVYIKLKIFEKNVVDFVKIISFHT